MNRSTRLRRLKRESKMIKIWSEGKEYKTFEEFLKDLEKFEKESRKVSIHVGGHNLGKQIFVGVPIKAKVLGKEKIVIVDLKSSKDEMRNQARDFVLAIDRWRRSLKKKGE